MTNLNQMIVIACKDNKIQSLKEYLNEQGQTIKYVTLEKENELSDRLYKLSDFNSSKYLIY